MSRGKVHHIMGPPTFYYRVTREEASNPSEVRNEDLYYADPTFANIKGLYKYEVWIFYDDNDKVWGRRAKDPYPYTLPC